MNDGSISNKASGSARVRQQIGQIGTNIEHARIVHTHSTTYQYSTESPPDMFAAACQYLAGGAGMKAADLIEDARARGYESSKVAYYWQLALLAGRPFDHLSPADFEKLDRAQDMARKLGPDKWTAAAGVIEDLLQCFIAQVKSKEGFDGDRFDRVIARYESLPEALRDEAGRHLALLLNGGIQDRLDSERRRQIERHRMGNGRRRRVPLFFEPDPAQPQRRKAASPDVRLRHWLALIGGAASFASGVFLLLVRVAETNLLTVGILAVLFVWGCLGAILLVPENLYYRAMYRRRRALRTAVLADRPGRFADTSSALDGLIADRFTEVAPADPDEATRFVRAVIVERTLLSDDLHTLYKSSDVAPVSPERIDWLIRWHVRRTADAWESGALRAVGPRHPTAGRQAALLLAISALAVGGCLGLVAIARWDVGSVLSMLAVVVLLCGGTKSVIKGATVYSEKRRFEEEDKGYERLLDEEEAAWRAERRRLSDRPGDAQMAEWLDYDKDHIRLSALREWGLSNRDVIAHVVLTEADPESASARVPDGPRRYSRYIVRLFLLTHNGVRHLAVHLDFASGAENKQQRHAFRYDAIASARIEEPTVRRHGRRQIATPVGGGPRDGTSRPIRRQALHLTLINGEHVEINADYEKLLADEDQHDNEALFTLEMETSGAVSTLRTLESVAGEGRDWIRREQERSRHAVSDYQHLTEAPPASWHQGAFDLAWPRSYSAQSRSGARTVPG